jgi:hypothetical protein
VWATHEDLKASARFEHTTRIPYFLFMRWQKAEAGSSRGVPRTETIAGCLRGRFAPSMSIESESGVAAREFVTSWSLFPSGAKTQARSDLRTIGVSTAFEEGCASGTSARSAGLQYPSFGCPYQVLGTPCGSRLRPQVDLVNYDAGYPSDDRCIGDSGPY